MRASINTANISIAATPDSHPDCRAPLIQIVALYGRAIQSVKVGFASAVARAGLDPAITPHVLRHTSATWLMNEGHKIWQVAGYLGMSPQILEQVYGKHHPDYQVEIVGAFKGRGSKR